MIKLGYIMPDGQEIDLEKYPCFSGSVHLEYAKKYIKNLKMTDEDKWKKWKIFSWNWEHSGNATECEFVMRVLGWIKVGTYSMPSKRITFAYLNRVAEMSVVAESKNPRMQTIQKYEENGYLVDTIPGTVNFSQMKDPPAWWYLEKEE